MAPATDLSQKKHKHHHGHHKIEKEVRKAKDILAEAKKARKEAAAAVLEVENAEKKAAKHKK